MTPSEIVQTVIDDTRRASLVLCRLVRHNTSARAMDAYCTYIRELEAIRALLAEQEEEQQQTHKQS